MNALGRTLAGALFAGLALGSSCDPVYNEQVAALGGEAPNVRHGPLHRPGQPCLVCHDGTLGNPSAFSVAGTVYTDPAPAAAKPAVGAEVTMTNVSDGKSFTATTNAVGTFYVLPSQWTPVYPFTVTVRGGTQKACMTSHVGRNGSCASCHFEPAGQASPGRVTLASDQVNGGCP